MLGYSMLLPYFWAVNGAKENRYFSDMTAQRIVLLTNKRREDIFIKLRASAPDCLADVARLLGLSISEALKLEIRLKEEILLERSYNELKRSLKNGN